MKIAVVRNTPEAEVIARRGRQNREYYREQDIEAVRDALIEGGHEATIVQGDVGLFGRLQDLARSAGQGHGALPALFVYNMAYGVQGDCRYTHLPSLLELAGIPYVGSGPRAHTICLDKHLTKVLLEHAGLPTPAFQLLTAAGVELSGELAFPLIVKPQFESTSFGVRVVDDRDELDAAVSAVLAEFSQPALVEQFVAGTEVNCGLLGNGPPRPLPVLEVAFAADAGPRAILDFAAKRDRVATHVCPARIDPQLAARVQALAVACFETLGCADCGRVDLRIDAVTGEPTILEMNSMVATHHASSYFHAARAEGISFAQLVNAVLEAAVARHTPAG